MKEVNKTTHSKAVLWEVYVFVSFDMSALSTYLKKIRICMNYTQVEVANLANLNIETLRRIETGKVIPKYETIEALSKVYREDLMSAFSFFRTSQTLFKLYQEIDRCIIDSDDQGIEKLEKSLDELIMNPEEINVVNSDELEQLKFFLVAIKDYYSERYDSSLEKLLDAIQISHPKFTLDNPKDFKTNMFESRMMLVVSLCLTQKSEHRKAIEIMISILKILKSCDRFDNHRVQLITKIYVNISYNYFNLRDYYKSINYAQQGIKFCRSHSSMYGLHYLYYRRAISKYRIGNRGYVNDLNSCYQILAIMGRNDLANKYKTITKDKYGIE